MEIFRGTERITEEQLKAEQLKIQMQEASAEQLEAGAEAQADGAEPQTSEDLNKIQGEQQMTRPATEETVVEKLASVSAPPESPLALIMAAVLNPSGTNLAGLASMFENYVEKMPGLPEYVREAGRGFIESLKKWALEQGGMNA
jgi:hypothetical protein